MSSDGLTHWWQRAIMLALYRKLIALRREHAALTGGAIENVHASDGVLSYESVLGTARLTITPI